MPKGLIGVLRPLTTAFLIVLATLWIGQVLPLPGSAPPQTTPGVAAPAVEGVEPSVEAQADPEPEPEQAIPRAVYLLKQGFVHDMLRAAVLVGALCAFLGVFVVLKRIVFVGAALANVASLGAALAFAPPVVAFFHWLKETNPALEPVEHFKPLLLALLLMLAAVAFFSQHRLGRRIPREALIGTAYASAAGLTLFLLSRVEGADQHSLDVIRGSIMGVPPQEIAEVGIAAALIGALHALFYKEFVLVSFDPEVARTLGYNSSRWELLWYLSLGVMIAVSIHVAGTVLVFAYLVIPAVSSLLISRRLGLVIALSVVLALLATVIGTVASLIIDVATSYCIIAVLTLFFGLAWLFRSLMNAFVSS